MQLNMHIPFYILKSPHQNKNSQNYNLILLQLRLTQLWCYQGSIFLKIYILSEVEFIFLLGYHFIDDVVFQLRAAGHCCMLETRGKSRENRAKPRCSTSVLVFGCWLMNHVIHLKLRQKQLLLQAEKINLLCSKWSGLKKNYHFE